MFFLFVFAFEDVNPLYTLSNLHSEAGQSLIQEARRQLKERGLATFPGFLTPRGVARAVEALTAVPYATDDTHNAYQLETDPNYPMTHIRNLKMRTRVASIAYDQLQGPARAVYDLLPAFVSAITETKKFKLADELGAATINVFEPGWDHAWHYDEAEYTTTLCLRAAEEGGRFEYTRPLRKDDFAFDDTAAVVNAYSNYSTEACTTPPLIQVADFEPGTLQIFAGRYSLHRVSTIEGNHSRLVAVYCFADKPGFVNTPSVQRMFWGRTA